MTQPPTNGPARIRIRFDVPGDQGRPDVPLGEATLERVGPAADVEAWRFRLALPTRPNWKTGTLPAFPRKRSGIRTNAFDLFYRVLRLAIHYRNRGGET